jgi:uncharacterized phiE125 gp8 family phage protein
MGFSLRRLIDDDHPMPKVCVTVQEIKDQCHITNHKENKLILGWIRGATEVAETRIRRSFMTQYWEQKIDEFPTLEFSCDRYARIKLYRPPLVEIESVTYVDTAGDVQTLTEGTDFEVDNASEPGSIYPVYGKTWPIARRQPLPITIIFKAGFGDDRNDVPNSFRDWIRAAVALKFRRRELQMEDIVKDVPHLASLLDVGALGDLVN